MKNYQEKVKPYQVGSKAQLADLQGKRQTFLDDPQDPSNRVDLKSEAAFRRARLSKKMQAQVCSAIQLNYCRRMQTMFSKWQLLTKLNKETNTGQNNTENKLLLLKSLVKD